MEILDMLRQDLRFAQRSFRRSAGFTTVALLSLTIGIGANLAIFSLLYTVLLQPLPYPEADRLVLVGERAPKQGLEQMPVSYPDIRDFAADNHTLSGLAGFWYSDFTCTGKGDPEKIRGSMVSASFTDVLGIRPLLGRTFGPDDETPEAANVVLISEGLWLRKWGGDPDVVGETVYFANEPFTIVGVLPESFRFPEYAELWTPIWKVVQRHMEDMRDSRDFYAVGRLNDGVTIEEARRDLEGIAARLAERFPETHADIGVTLTPLRTWIFGDLERPVLIFYAVVCLVLLLACANVAALLMARNATRMHEIGMRTALGAGRVRMMGQMLTESLLMAVLGGGLGLAVAWLGRSVLLHLAPIEPPPYLNFTLQETAVFLVIGIVLGTGLTFGMLPSLAFTRADLRGMLQAAGSRLTGGATGLRALSSLVVLEITFALVVLIGASLMVKSLIRHDAIDPGFEPEGLVSAYVTVPGAEDLADFYRDVCERVHEVPGMSQVTIVTELPIGRIDGSVRGYPEDVDHPDPGLVPRFPTQACGVDYFRTMGIPILRGRGFEDRDRGNEAPRVVVVNDAFARHRRQNGDLLGDRLVIQLEGAPSPERFEIVGVAANTFNDGWGRPVRPAVYLLFDQFPNWDAFLVARTRLDAASAFEAIRHGVQSVDSQVPLSLFRTMDGALAEANWQIRFYSWLFGVFSFIATILAAVGVYGVMAYTVACRTREFGIRIAIGGGPSGIVALAARQGLTLSGIGLIAGCLISAAGMRLLAGLLFQVHPFDTGAYGIALLLMGIVSLVASCVPALPLFKLSLTKVLQQN